VGNTLVLRPVSTGSVTTASLAVAAGRDKTSW
jgi:hypothetical protein